MLSFFGRSGFELADSVALTGVPKPKTINLSLIEIGRKAKKNIVSVFLSVLPFYASKVGLNFQKSLIGGVGGISGFGFKDCNSARINGNNSFMSSRIVSYYYNRSLAQGPPTGILGVIGFGG